MALTNRPYYIAPKQTADSIGHTDEGRNSSSDYPDLESSVIPNAHMYSTDGTHQPRRGSLDLQLPSQSRSAMVLLGHQGRHDQDIGQAHGDLRQIPGQSSDGAVNEYIHKGMLVRQALEATGTTVSGCINGNEVDVSDTTASPDCHFRFGAPCKRRQVSHPTMRDRGLPTNVSVDSGETRDTVYEICGTLPHGTVLDALVSGVHSSAALFRSPSASSKKYTRPSMSKLYASLAISPENFIHLQAAAKGYMMDPAHPGRQDCVGQRGKGDSDLVKLRLWNCVKDFLEDESRGELYFGMRVPREDGFRRSMTWPRDCNNLIRAVMPLLRRMVTNERQRQYAVQARKGGVSASSKIAYVDRQSPPSPLHEGPSDCGFNPYTFEMGLRKLYSDIVGTDFGDRDISRAYEEFNLPTKLGNLNIVLGLPEADFNGVTAAIQCHVRRADIANREESLRSPLHNEDIVSQIIAKGLLEHGKWHVDYPGDIHGKHQFAQLVLRDMYRTIKDATTSVSPQDESNESRSDGSALSKSKLELPSERTWKTVARPQARNVSVSRDLTDGTVELQFNIISGGQRMLPRFDASARECPDLQSVYKKIQQWMNGTTLDGLRISALLPEGLVEILGDIEWTSALHRVCATCWMENELKVLVKL